MGYCNAAFKEWIWSRLDTGRHSSIHDNVRHTEYNKGVFQSGVTELLYAAKTDRKHYIVVSSVEKEAWCAVTRLFPCYEECQPNTNLVFVKAGALTFDQLKTPMLVFSHGGKLNPHVMGRQLTHFAPVTVPDQISDEDMLNQCCILLTPDVEFSKDNSSLHHSMNLTDLNIETLYQRKHKYKWSLCLRESRVKIKKLSCTILAIG